MSRRRRTLSRSFFHWLSVWRDVKAATRGPRPFLARQLRKPMHRWVNRRVR